MCLLLQVNVTFPASEGCNEQANFFVAHNYRSLPSVFVDESGGALPPSPALQLHHSEGGTVITLIATWLNTTIIIRRVEGFLAVTLTVTGHMAFESQGLCTAGCPHPQRVGKEQ